MSKSKDETYNKIQQLNQQKSDYIHSYKSKLVKSTNTELLIKKDLNIIDEKLESLRILNFEEKRSFETAIKQVSDDQKKCEYELEHEQQQIIRIDSKAKEIELVLIEMQQQELKENSNDYIKRLISYKQEELQEFKSDLAQKENIYQQAYERLQMIEEEIISKEKQTFIIKQQLQFKQQKLSKQHGEQFSKFAIQQSKVIQDQTKQRQIEELEKYIKEMQRAILKKETDREQAQSGLIGQEQFLKQLSEKIGLINNQYENTFSLDDVPYELKEMLKLNIDQKQIELCFTKVEQLQQIFEKDIPNMDQIQIYKNKKLFQIIYSNIEQWKQQVTNKTWNREQIQYFFKTFEPQIDEREKQKVISRELALQICLKQIQDIQSMKQKTILQLAQIDNDLQVERQQLNLMIQQKDFYIQNFNPQRNENIQTENIDESFEEQSSKKSLQVISDFKSFQKYSQYSEEIDKIQIPYLLQERKQLEITTKEYRVQIAAIKVNIQQLQDEIENLNLKSQVNQNAKDLTVNARLDKLSLHLESLYLKKTELQERVKFKESKFKTIKTQVEKVQTEFQNRQQMRNQELEMLGVRQKELLGYMEQIDKQIKPSLKEIEKEVKEIDNNIFVEKEKLVNVQKLINMAKKESNYQQLSTSKNLFDKFNTNNFDGKTNSQGKFAEKKSSVTDSSGYFEVNINLQFDKNNMNSSQDGNPDLNDIKTGHFSLEQDQIISLDKTSTKKEDEFGEKLKDILLKLKPLINGIDIFKKTFDTRFIVSNSQPQRFNPIGSNNRISPDMDGYAMRKLVLSKKDFCTLEFRNPHDDKITEISVDVKKCKINVPKVTLDSVKFQKDERKIITNLSKNLIETMSKSQITSPQKQTMQQKEQAIYKQKCLDAQYYSITLILEDKEIDILIPEAGGFYNYIYFKSALDILSATDKKTLKKLGTLFTQ